MARTTDVHAAGAVVLRKPSGGGREVLLVHRPRYDDWSFPKGKLDRGEHEAVAAVREVAEETGLLVRLGPRLGSQRYPANGSGRTKLVDYWVARVSGSDDVSTYRPNHEIDQVAWFPVERAARRLTYDRDRDTLEEAMGSRRRTRALVVLRHTKAWSRKSWRHDDRQRPLLAAGLVQADRLVPLLDVYGPGRVLTSSSVRCVQTVLPYAAAHALTLEAMHCLSEESFDAGVVAGLLEDVLAGDEDVVLCTHRPVLPPVLGALGVQPTRLEPGGMLVLHHRGGRVRATEELTAP